MLCVLGLKENIYLYLCIINVRILIILNHFNTVAITKQTTKSLRRVTYANELDLRRVTYANELDLRRVTYANELDLRRVTYANELDLRRVTCANELDLRRVTYANEPADSSTGCHLYVTSMPG